MKFIKWWSFEMRRPYVANAEGVPETLDSWWRVQDFADYLRERAAQYHREAHLTVRPALRTRDDGDTTLSYVGDQGSLWLRNVVVLGLPGFLCLWADRYTFNELIAEWDNYPIVVGRKGHTPKPRA